MRFYDRVPYEQHIDRFNEIDLFLDTFPYGGHTVLSEALWSGCPAVSLMGKSFHSRVGGSLLSAVGLPQLAVNSMADYVDCAVHLGRSPELIYQMQQHLAASPHELNLFHSKRYTRSLEAAFVRAMSYFEDRVGFEDIDV
jgi:predicted O-linked N-acetylglucosamine transferase (SPINDLY family)